MSEAIAFPRVFEELASPCGAAPDTIRAAFDAILAGAWTPVQIAGFAVTLRLRGETAPIIAAAVDAMRSVMVPVVHGLPVVVDTCGTGGDGLGTLNVSTASAIVVASVGLPVAKHGNRSVSSRAGSADVLEALGLPLDVPAQRQAEVLRRAGIAFLFAPAHHPAMRHGGVARRELGIRTVFNALGPVANPAHATHQLVGAYDDALRPILAATLAATGSTRAWVVRGEDGLDEVSPFEDTRVTELRGGRLFERVIGPRDFGFAPSPAGAIAGGDARDNAAAILAILRGEAHPAHDAVALNAAAAIAIARGAVDASGFHAAGAEARAAIRSGAAIATLERWIAVAREARADDGRPA